MAKQNNWSRITVCLHPCLAKICMSNRKNWYTSNSKMRNVMSDKTFNGSDSLRVLLYHVSCIATSEHTQQHKATAEMDMESSHL